jgi:hypothetical protein
MKTGAFFFLVLLLSLLLPSHSADESPAAVVTSVQGTVKVREPGDRAWRQADLLTVLAPGAEVKISGGGRAVLSFTGTAAQAHLLKPCHVTVTRAGVVPKNAASASAFRMIKPGERTSALLPSGINIDRMGGGRRPSEPITLMVDRLAKDTAPLVAWEVTQQDFDAFEISVEEKDTAVRVFKASLPGDRREVRIDGALQYGGRYVIFLRAFRKDGGPWPDNTKPPLGAEFSILSSQDAEKMRALETEAEREFEEDRSDTTPLALLITEYLKEGMYSPALETAKRLRKLRPHDKRAEALVKRLDNFRRDNIGKDSLRDVVEPSGNP